MYTTNFVSTVVSLVQISKRRGGLTLGIVALAEARAASAMAIARNRVEAALERRHVRALLVAVAHLNAVLDIEGRRAAAAACLHVKVDV